MRPRGYPAPTATTKNMPQVPTGPAEGGRQVDDLAQRLAAMGDVLREAVNVVAAAYVGADACPSGCHAADHVSPSAFLALADAVERAQPGAVEATRKALGR